MRKIPVPFYENSGDGSQCMQVAMQCVLKYFLDKDISLDLLDTLTHREKDMRTWTSQIVTVLYDLWLDLRYFSKEDIRPFLEWEPFIRRHFAADADKILQYTDVPVLVESVDHLMKYDIFEKRCVDREEIQDHIDEWHIPLMLIDYNYLSGAEWAYQWHFVVVTWYDEEHILYHESWPKNPEANKKIAKKLFIDAWNANGTDNDLVVVYGKRG